jgi:S-DNA-T family DNA segregation ATPase FtsK/SpoIIIE
MLHKHAREVRLVRGLVLLAEAAALAVGGVLLSSCSVLLWIPVGVVAVPVLAWIGRPDDKPIMTSAVVPVVIDRLTIELIVRTLGVLGIGEMNKEPGDLIERRAPVHLLGHCRPAPPWAFHRNRLLLVVA